jgi:hypothetical protein
MVKWWGLPIALGVGLLLGAGLLWLWLVAPLRSDLATFCLACFSFSDGPHETRAITTRDAATIKSDILRMGKR